MTKTNIYLLLFALTVSLYTLSSCNKKNNVTVTVHKEDVTAKKMLQGIWINDDDETPALRVKGDTIYYPDSTATPAYFQIFHDTLAIAGGNIAKYKILKQAWHLFVFKNQAGDEVKLYKSDDPSYKSFFEKTNYAASINQGKLIKRDSVVVYGNDHYHWYIQVNPTSYKVYKPNYNDEGVEVDNVYYDNIIHVSLFNGASQLFSRDFHKEAFSGQIPQQTLKQSILSDIVYKGAGTDGFHFLADICIPDSPSSYQITIIISFSGKVKLKV